MKTLDPAWGVASRNDLTVAYRRCTMRDRLQLLGWVQAWRAGEAGGLTAETMEREEVAAISEAMAGRLIRWPSGEAWTDSALVGIASRNPGLWAWLYGLLWWPVLEDGLGAAQRETLSEALQCPPGAGVPGDPAGTDCRVCLAVVHEEWDPARGKFGRPTGQPYPFAREMGDTICQACRRWDVEAGRARPGIGAMDIELARLARDRMLTGRALDAGGLLDQDAELALRLQVIEASPWWAGWTEGLAVAGQAALEAATEGVTDGR